MALLCWTSLSILLLRIVLAENLCEISSAKSCITTMRCHNTLITCSARDSIKHVTVEHCKNNLKSSSPLIDTYNGMYSQDKGRISLTDFQSNKTATLSIKNVTNDDTGTYVWFIEYETGYDYFRAFLNVDICITNMRCHHTLITCSARDSIKHVTVEHCKNNFKSSSPLIDTHNGKDSHDKGRISLTDFQSNKTATLSIKNVTNDDTGTYVWFIEYETGYDYFRAFLNVDICITNMRCHNTLITCSAGDSIEHVTVEQCKNNLKSSSPLIDTHNGKDSHDKGRISLTDFQSNKTATLSIKNVTNDDTGTYIWFIEYETGYDYFRAFLNVDCETEKSPIVSEKEPKHHIIIIILLPTMCVLGIGCILFVVCQRCGNRQSSTRGRSSSSTPLYMKDENIDLPAMPNESDA
ncbi:uncharacterized protein LOC115090827 [Rhinatrema bivittatum]|uniref:uncharacterized protein LOC115090827 n=1 Tax=Rhinatrema bivittatum TaxID=194408 RepID=UPI00112B5218|nr:uncharacterized protein LOC115090827 [Rhinatrema bivittatum]XP_029456238.1 uncharacterized protein LOC115090827 [Rhinatrema bivittatum]XP_029456239.1 uncharacterized protein LOC115090827 [Rhinatrema bivittatum]